MSTMFKIPNRPKTTKVTSDSDGILVRLKNMIAAKLKIDVVQLKCYIDQYVSEFGDGDSSKSNMTKSNMYNEFTRNKMTFRVFIKFLRVIRTSKIQINIKITTLDGHEVEVTDDVKLLRGKMNEEEG